MLTNSSAEGPGPEASAGSLRRPGASGLDNATDFGIFPNARSVAVVGASEDRTKIGGRVIDFLTRAGFAGAVYPVNPQAEQIQGRPSYQSLRDIGAPVDLAIVARSAEHCISTVREAGECGVKAAVIFAAGFAEAGPAGRELQDELVAVARKHGVRLLGPNTNGFASAPRQVIGSFASNWADPATLPLRDGRVSFVGQSGAVGAFTHAMAFRDGLYFRDFVSVGNEADITVNDVLEHLVADPAVSAIGGYLEGISDGGRFADLCLRARSLGKRIVLMKVARSGAAAKAAASHTGALVGSDAAYDAVFRESGVVRVDGIREMVDVLTLCDSEIPVADPRVGIVSISGGVGVWAIDRCEASGLRLAEFSPQTVERLAGVLPTSGPAANPIDLTGLAFQRPQMLRQCVEALAGDSGVDLVYVTLGPQLTLGAGWGEDLADIRSETRTPIVVGWIGAEEGVRNRLRAARIPVFGDFERPLEALALLNRAAVHRPRGEALDPTEPAPPSVAPTLSGPRHHVLAEDVAKQRLEALGLPVPRQRRVRDIAEAVDAANRLGYPIVMKVGTEGQVIHKTDYGLVRLGVDSPDAAAAAFQQLLAGARSARISAPKVFCEAQAASGTDVIVSLIRDDTFGPFVVLGLGGEWVEIFDEVAMRRAPLTAEAALELIEGSRKLPEVLTRRRGSEPADVDALAKLVARISKLATADGPVQLELNPVRVHPRGDGVTILDALWIEA